MKVCWDPATRAGCRARNRDSANYCMKCGRRLVGAMHLLDPGDRLQGIYKVEHVVGVGGSGAVYLIRDTASGGVERALKESNDPQQREQFALEAAVLQPLSHPNVPRVYTYFNENDRDYMVMDFVPGHSLAEVLAERAAANQPPLDESAVVGYAVQICRALEYLHSRDPHPVIHRDIKPENIRITPHGEVKLVDFGLLKRLDTTNPSTLAVARGLTPVYASPEQWGLLTGTHTDMRSDIYSLAATLYHLLTGKRPLSALNRATGANSGDPLIRPRQINPAITARAEAAILRAMAFQPDERFATAREFRAALAAGTDTMQAR